MQANNEATFKRYRQERIANEIKVSTLQTDRQLLHDLDKFLSKPYEEASKEDMVGFIAYLQQKLKASTLHLWKSKLKLFYNWLFQLAPREYPDCVKWIRTWNPRRATKTKGYVLPLDPEDVLNDEDVLALINACDHPRDQALISVTYETGAEPMEALNMKVKSVQFDEHGAVVSLEGESGVRRLRVVDSIPYLQAWLNVHSCKNDPGAPLWSLRRGEPEPLGYHGFWQLCRKLKRRSGLKKPLRPNYLRHASLTKMAKVLPEQKLKKFAGWTPDSRMAAVYVHLAGKDLDEDILRLHGKSVTEEKEPLKGVLSPRICPRCQHESPATYLWCGFCGQRLDVELNETDQVARDRFLKWLAEEALKDPEILKRWYAASDRVTEREKKQKAAE